MFIIVDIIVVTVISSPLSVVITRRWTGSLNPKPQNPTSKGRNLSGRTMHRKPKKVNEAEGRTKPPRYCRPEVAGTAERVLELLGLQAFTQYTEST